ncbi:MAG: hypothetical protein OXU31_04850 [Gammaproteobacteria bacterium]|nr:hypothetical protein [Gammaproteobacteria bacterium]
MKTLVTLALIFSLTFPMGTYANDKYADLATFRFYFNGETQHSGLAPTAFNLATNRLSAADEEVKKSGVSTALTSILLSTAVLLVFTDWPDE